MASVVPYLSILVTGALLCWTLTHFPPSSTKRPLMLSVIMAFTLWTAIIASSCSISPGWNSFIGVFFGPILTFGVIDIVCLSRLSYDVKKRATIGRNLSLDMMVWTADIMLNRRQIGTPRLVKNVPHFSSTDPGYRPSRLYFLTVRGVRFLLLYLVIDLVTSKPPSDELLVMLGKDMEPFLGRMASGQMGMTALGQRAGLTMASWVLVYLLQSLMYDLFSIIAVGSFLSDVEDWPPHFGSIYEAYTVRQFWGVFWHQGLRQALTANSSFIVHKMFRLPKHSITARYAKLLVSFFISGIIHINSDRLTNVSLRESNVVFFFSVQAVGIMIEDVVIAIHKWLGEKYGTSDGDQVSGPTLWQRALGLGWVLLFMTYSTPFWSYPAMRRGDDFPLPLRFFVDLV